MILELRPKTLEDGFSRFLDLQKQRSVAPAHEQADRTERADASDPDDLEGDVLERVALDEATPLRGEAVLVGGENAPFIDAMPCVAASREMIMSGGRSSIRACLPFTKCGKLSSSS